AAPSSSEGTAVGGAVAITWSEHDTNARLGDDANAKLTGDAEVSASHSAQLRTQVDSEASGKGAGIGVSVAVAIGLDDTRAAIGGDVDAGGKATVIAAHSVTSDTPAAGSAQ